MSVISIAQHLVQNWHLSPTSTCKLRIFADRDFLTSDSKSIQAGNPEVNGFYQEVNVTVAGTVATIAAFSIDSTRDSRSGLGARYSFYFYTDAGVKLDSFGGYESIEVPESPLSSSFPELRVFNSSPVARPPDLLTYSRTEIDAKIAAVIPGGLFPLSTGGTGSNLSATGPGLLKQASVGANVTVAALTAADVQPALTLREVDLVPSFTYHTLEFNQANGFVVTNPSAGVGRVSLSSFPLSSTTGTLPPARGGSGATALPTDGQLLIGNSAMGIFAVASLGVGTSLSATAGAGTLSLNAIQGIRTIDTPTFAGVITTAQAALRLGPFGAPAGSTGELRFLELAANGTNYTGFKAPDALAFTGTGNLIYILPSDDPINGDMLTAGAPSGGFCALSWTTPAGAGTGYATIQEEGVSLTQFATLNFIGAALTAADGTGKTNVTLSQSPVGSASVVGTGRLISNGTGITGGGDLSADRTLSVVANTTNQQVRVSKGASLQGTRREINFIEGANVTLTVADDAGNDRVNVTIASTGGGAGGISGSGTTARLPKFSSSTALTDSLLLEGSGFLSLLASGGAASALRFFDDDGSAYVGLKSPATVTASLTFTLPGADGTAGQYIKTDAAGNLAFDSAVRSLTLNSTGNDVALTPAGSDLTLSIPSASATARGVVTIGAQTIAGAKTFTDDLKISKVAPMLTLEDTSALKHLAIQSVGNGYDFRDIADASGALLFLDLANNRVGVGTLAPASPLHVKGLVTLGGATSGSVGLQAPATGGTATYTLPATPDAGKFASVDGAGVISWASAYKSIQNNAGAAIGDGNLILKVANGTNTTANVSTAAGVTTISIDAATSSGVTSVTAGANEDIVATPTIGAVGISTKANTRTTNDLQAFLMLPDVQGSNVTSTVFAINTAFVARVYVRNKIKFNRMAIGNVTAAASVASVAIYTPDGATRLVYSGLITVDATSGAKIATSLTIDASVTVDGKAQLEPGYYLMGWTQTVGNSLTCASFTSTGAYGALVGAGASTGSTATNASVHGTAGATVGGAMPATIASITGTVGAPPGNTTFQIIAVKLFNQ